MIELKNSLIKNKSKILSGAYGVWIVISIMLAYIQPHKYASYFTDLPVYLKNLPPFVLSLTYLLIFIPVILLVVAFALYVLFFVVRGLKKNKF